MENNRAVWAIVGFIIGAMAGSGLIYLLLLMTNVFYRLLDKPLIPITWGQVLPVGVLIGLALALNMLNHPFGD